MNKRAVLNNIRKRWDKPEKLLEYLAELDKQQEIDIELSYKKGMKETVKNYSILFAYTLRKSGFGKKTLPLLIENINTISSQLEKKELTLEDMNKELEKAGVHIS
jgi:hypothetical protein